MSKPLLPSATNRSCTNEVPFSGCAAETAFPGHVRPSLEAWRRPSVPLYAPTATTAPFAEANPVISNDAGAADDHEVPSTEVTMVPDSPPARNRVPVYVTARNLLVVPELRRIHVAASDEVMIVPASPTAT